jgi:hypothetical protein
VKNGDIKIDQPRIFALADASKAHEAIEGRGGVGSIILRASS